MLKSYADFEQSRTASRIFHFEIILMGEVLDLMINLGVKA